MKRNLWLSVLAVAVLLNPVAVEADDFYVIAGGGVGTRITSLPKTINAPGFYYLTDTLSSPSGNGITVNADNVTIDLMGFGLNGNSSSYGIYVNEGKKNLEVRNGILSGWFDGVFTSLGLNFRFINIRADNNTIGLSLNGNSIIVRGCTFSNNNSSAIALSGSGIISGNTIFNSGSIGIYLNGGYATLTSNNIAFAGIGIQFNGAGSIIGNTVIASSSQTGIKLEGAAGSYVMLDQNTVSGPGTHFSGGTASYGRGNNAGF